MSHYKYTAFLLLLLCVEETAVHSQASVPEVTSIDLKEDRIYIFSRGTRSKAYVLARQFNMRDSNSTHVGIGFYKDDQFFIYNVVDEAPKGQSALVINSLSCFLLRNDVYYFSLWECTNDARELALMKEVLETYQRKQIAFDVQFKLGEDDALYCSEFCAQVLSKLQSRKFAFTPFSRTLNNPLFEAVLGRKRIDYYPVDFFQGSPFVRKIYEWQKE